VNQEAFSATPINPQPWGAQVASFRVNSGFDAKPIGMLR
jgi:hypothetical protein